MDRLDRMFRAFWRGARSPDPVSQAVPSNAPPAMLTKAVSIFSQDRMAIKKGEMWGVGDIVMKLVRTQNQLREHMPESLIWTDSRCRRWLGKELCICASEFVESPPETLPDPRVAGRKEYLMLKIMQLGHHFEDVVNKHGLFASPKKRAKNLDKALEDLLQRLATEFSLGDDNDTLVAKLFGRLMWVRRRRQLLIIAAKDNLVDMLKHLVESGTVKPDGFRGGSTVLHVAAATGNVEITEYLVSVMKEKGVPLNPRNLNSGYTPLHDAAAAGKESTVRVIVEADRSVLDDRTHDGWTPVLLAMANNHPDTANYLIYKVPDLVHVNKWHQSAIDYARADSRMWQILVTNIPDLDGMRHRSRKVQNEVVMRYMREFTPEEEEE